MMRRSDLGSALCRAMRSSSSGASGRIPLWKVPLIVRHFRRLKAEHADEIRIFPGATATLEALKAEGVQLALVTSDSEPNVRHQLGSSHFELFSAVECNASLFGKAAKFRRVIERSPCPRNEIVAIGDEIRDIEAARKVGICSAAVAWGYTNPSALRQHAPDFVFEDMEDIVATVCDAGRRHD
jgi:phosphoglycolate phosphatase